MTKNRNEKQAAREDAEREGIHYVAARRKGASPELHLADPDFRMTVDVQANGLNVEGLPLQVWQVQIRVLKPEEFEDSEYDAFRSVPTDDTDTDMYYAGDYMIAGSAVAVLYPAAARNRNFAFDLDSSEEGLTLLGEELIAGAEEGYPGWPSSELFENSIDQGDLLMVGGFEIEPQFVGRGYPVKTVEALLRVVGRLVGVVVVEPTAGHGEGGRAYWRTEGFEQFRRKSVFVLKM